MSSFLIHRFRKLETIGPLTLQLKGGGIAELCSEVKNIIALIHQVDNHSIQTKYPIHYNIDKTKLYIKLFNQCVLFLF